MGFLREYSGHSLRQPGRGRVFSGGSRGRLSPVTAGISHLSFGLPIGRAGLLFSERPVSLRNSGLHPFGTVLEIRTFEATYELQRKEVLPLLSDTRERLISNSPSRGSNPPAPASQSDVWLWSSTAHTGIHFPDGSSASFNLEYRPQALLWQLPWMQCIGLDTEEN